MLGPKKPLLLTIVEGLANGTVSAMKCADVIAAVESVGEHCDGTHGDFTLDDPAGP